MEQDFITERRNALYNYLIENYTEQYFIPKIMICNELNEYYQWRDTDTRLCRTMENDVRFINSSGDYDKIIVSSGRGYKIGNKKQTEDYIHRLFKRDFKSIKRNYTLAKKKGLDGQFNTEMKMIETYVKEG